MLGQAGNSLKSQLYLQGSLRGCLTVNIAAEGGFPELL